jgi:hypothetical protein
MVWFRNSVAALAISTVPVEGLVGTLMLPTAVQVATSDGFFVIRTLSAPGTGVVVAHAVNQIATAAETEEPEITRMPNSNQ